ncbi:MAG: glycosyltransferase family 2 protein [Planctomycetota bacterium]
MSVCTDVSILVVCYKSIDLIGPTLQGVFEHTEGCEYEVLLADCSDDGTIPWVAEHYPQVKIIPNDENLGFARGNNFLSQHANGRHLLLLNPDVIVHDNAIGELYRCSLRYPDAGAWGGQTRLPDGRIDPSCQQSTPTLARLALAAIGQESKTIGGLSPGAKQTAAVEGLSGAFLMISRDTWNEFQGFDTSFFMYAEELDLCYRLRKSGRELIMTPDAEITHLVGGGSALNPKRATSIARAKMHFLRKHRSPAYAFASGLLLWLGAFNRMLSGVLGKSERASRMRTSHGSVALHPNRWWSGYTGGDVKTSPAVPSTSRTPPQ